MASANLSAYNSALKQTWTEDTLYEQLYQGDDFLSSVEKTRRFQVGKQAVTPIHTSRNGGYTALPAGGGTLNAAGNQGSNQAIWNYTHHHQQIAIEGELIDGTLSDIQSVVNGLDFEVTTALKDMRRQLVRQLFSNGDGVIAGCGTTTASSTVVLATPDGQQAIQRGWLFKNGVVDIGTAAAPTTVVAGTTISAVDPVNFTITIGSSVTTSASHQVSYKGSRGAGTVNEMNGLQNIVGTGTLGGIAPASEPSWQATVDSTSQALTLPILYQTRRKAWQLVGTADGPDTLVTGYKQQEAIYKLLQAQTRYAGDAGLNTGNIDEAKLGGLKPMVMLDCKDQHMFFVKMGDLFICSTDKPYWQNKVTGGEILAWIQGTDSYGAKISYRLQLCARRRDNMAALTGLT